MTRSSRSPHPSANEFDTSIPRDCLRSRRVSIRLHSCANVMLQTDAQESFLEIATDCTKCATASDENVSPCRRSRGSTSSIRRVRPNGRAARRLVSGKTRHVPGLASFRGDRQPPESGRQDRRQTPLVWDLFSRRPELFHRGGRLHTNSSDFTIQPVIGATTIRHKRFFEELWARGNAPWANAAVPA
jgi:hypothetical protein